MIDLRGSLAYQFAAAFSSGIAASYDIRHFRGLAPWHQKCLRAQVIHRSDETLKAAFSCVSSGTFCQSGKVFGDKTWRYQKLEC
jgi:hypothetical protein